jgi:isopenicillin N synthase-like dioxygenase
MDNPEFTLPIISIAPYLSSVCDAANSMLRQETSTALHNACMNYGFFYLDISCYVDASETDELVRLAREFFALPQAEKDLLSLKNEDYARGRFCHP